MKKELATFAGGCFWCMEPPFKQLAGVESVTAGFIGGVVDNPTYEQVASCGTGHYEAIQIQFQPELCSYQTLLELYWRQIDPTDEDGQFADRGWPYRTVIFYHNEEQRLVAEKSKQALQDSGIFDKPIATDIQPATTFFPADDKHQNYHEKNPAFYCEYRQESGRDAFLNKVWKDK